MKTSRWWCVVSALVLGACGILNTLKADEPWPPLVSVLALDPYAAEAGSDPATFLVVRVGPATTALTVQYTLAGEATNGDDYETLSGEVTIPEGAYFAAIDVRPHDDFLIEGAESIVLALQQPPVLPPPYIITWPSVAAAEIADNDRPPTNSPPIVSLVHPPDGAVFDGGDEILLIARARDRDGRVRTVEFFANGQIIGIVTNRPVFTTPDLLRATDDPRFALEAEVFSKLEFPPIPGPTPIPIPGDLFKLLWPDAPPGKHVLMAVATDNDGDSTESEPVEIEVLSRPRPVVNIRATDPIASESNPTTDFLDTATFTVHRRGPTNDALRVFYRIGGTAGNGVDYNEIAHSVLIPASERRATVMVEPIDDLLVEGRESVVLSLVEPPVADELPRPADWYEVGRSHTARASIRDNDVPPNRPPLVRLVNPDDGEVFLAPAEIRLAALARDFDGYVTQVEFFEGTNSLGIVTNNPASISAHRPPFSLVWSNVPPGHYVLTAVATDNDGETTPSEPVEIKVVPRFHPPMVNITAPDADAAEPGVLTVIDSARFEITRTGNTAHPLTVFYRIDGSAKNGVDYSLILNRVEIPSGASSAEVLINPLHDTLVEGTETVVVKLIQPPVITPVIPNPGWYRIGSNDVASAKIRDNDSSPTNLPPRVVMVHPKDGDVFEAPVEIKLAASAHDADGRVQFVEFFDGNQSLGIVSNHWNSVNSHELLPERLFQLLWKNVQPGPHVLSAKATDNRGAVTTSEPVHIRVLPPQRPPVVTIHATDPSASEGAWLTPWPVASIDPVANGPVILPRPNTATFTASRRGDTSEDLTVYYKLEGTAVNGKDYHELTGKVVIPKGQNHAAIVVSPMDDNETEKTETVVAKLLPVFCPAIYPPSPACYTVGDPHSAVAYIYDNDANHSPKVEIVHPGNGDIFRAGSDIEIDVVARDPDGWVSTVTFFANDKKIGEQSIYFIVPPPPGQPQKFSMVWSNVPAGEYKLAARATDERGATSLSDPVHIKVAPLPSLPVVTIEAIDPIATEPNPLSASPVLDSATFRISRTGNNTQPLTVFYRVSGTASNGVDYLELAGAVEIPGNAPSALVHVAPKGDNPLEGTESVILTLIQPPCVLSNVITPDCYLVGSPRRDVAYIRDHERPNAPPTVAIVSPANGSVFSAPVDLRLVAAAGDSDGWVTTVEFFAGDKSLGIVHNPIVIVDVPTVRLPELDADVLTANTLKRPFTLVWSNAPPGVHKITAVATDNAGDTTRSEPIEIVVREPGAVPVVRIMAVDAVAREGTTNTATFRVRRTGSINSALTVFYSIHGTAVNGSDYETIPGSVVIPAGRRSARIVITPIDDNLPERIESVRLHLITPPFGPDTYEIGRPARAGAVILDNDHPLLTPERVADGSLHLRLDAMQGLPFRLEASTNLVDWEEIASGINSENGISVVDDRTDSQRFFRIVPEYGDLDEAE